MNTSSTQLSLSSFASPLWSAGFRPFYLLGTAYGLLLMLSWLAAFTGWWAPAYPLRLWHAHEMIFGFAGAIVCGFVLTALPSWAGTREIRGGELALLTAAWLAGRVALWLAPVLPAGIVAGCDGLVFLLLAVMVTPDLLKAENKAYLALLPILAGLFCGALLFHLGVEQREAAVAEWALRVGLFALIAKFVLVGGYLTPIFTGNVLREKAAGEAPSFHPGIEALAIGSTLAFIVFDLVGAGPFWRGGAAAVACAANAGRLLRWRGWAVRSVPILAVMHLAYAWLVVAFALAALGDLTGVVPPGAWVHAFTVGALGLMMLGLISRVTLRHTGRPLKLPRALILGYVLMFCAGLLRTLAGLQTGGEWLIAVSLLLWTAAFALYLVVCAAMLVQPALTREGQV